MTNVEIARRLVRMAQSLSQTSRRGRRGTWPKDVEEGGLRGALGLNKDEPLEDQASPSDVAKFFDDADAKGRGMVMYAVNSNQDNAFWKKVGDLIAD